MTNLNYQSADIPEQHLNSAIRKAYWRLLPLLFVCYIIAYIDRVNVSLAKLKMTVELPHFDDAVIGFGAGVFFIGYFLLEIPGTILVEKWSARKWICRIMVSWGIIAALTAFVHHKVPVITDLAVWLTHGMFWLFAILVIPLTWLPAGGLSDWATATVTSLRSPVGPDIAQFYSIRFLLGLAEAGFFPGAIVYMTHWFPSKSRSRALSWFLIGTPSAQILSPKISNLILKIGSSETVNGVTTTHAPLLGMNGWQWLYIFWGIPAVVLGVVVLVYLHDHPREAPWLSPEERKALEDKLEEEKAATRGRHHMRFVEALYHPKVLLLALAYCLIVTGNYGVDFFLPSILKEWYSLNMNSVTWLVLLPACAALVAILVVGWSSDHFKERRWHAALPGLIGGIALLLVPSTKGNIGLTIGCFMVAAAGLKAYLPPFWCLPSLFLTEVAAAGSIGLINSVGNLGGYFGPTVVGKVRAMSNSFAGGIYFLGTGLVLYSVVILLMRFDHKPKKEQRDFEAVAGAAAPESA